MGEKPKVRCIVALTYAQGDVWGQTHLISLENVPRAIRMGLSVVGPDPCDLIDLKIWEDEQRRLRGSV